MKLLYCHWVGFVATSSKNYYGRNEGKERDLFQYIMCIHSEIFPKYVDVLR